MDMPDVRLTLGDVNEERRGEGVGATLCIHAILEVQQFKPDILVVSNIVVDQIHAGHDTWLRHANSS
jgi:hypothetical protein